VKYPPASFALKKIELWAAIFATFMASSFHRGGYPYFRSYLGPDDLSVLCMVQFDVPIQVICQTTLSAEVLG
jgi:hypothetical protein